MCGIFGAVVKSTSPASADAISKLLTKLALANVLRGTDSTGVCRIDKDGRHDTYKTLEPSWACFEDDRFKELVRPKQNTAVILGHTRLTSVGNVTLQNAHPHFAGRFIAIHNGTVNNHDKFFNAPVDSLTLTKTINDLGFKAFLHLKGHATMVVVDRHNPQTPIFWKSGDRPLHFFIDEYKNLVFSSEAEHLEQALGERIKNEKDVFSLTDDTVISFEDGQLYRLFEKISMETPFSNFSSSKTDKKKTYDRMSRCVMCGEKKAILFKSFPDGDLQSVEPPMVCYKCLDKKGRFKKCPGCDSDLGKKKFNFFDFYLCEPCYGEKKFNLKTVIKGMSSGGNHKTSKCLRCGKKHATSKSFPVLERHFCYDCNRDSKVLDDAIITQAKEILA